MASYYGMLMTLPCTGEVNCEALNLVTTDLQCISNLISASKMQLNIAKLTAMRFIPKSFNHNIHILPVYVH